MTKTETGPRQQPETTEALATSSFNRQDTSNVAEILAASGVTSQTRHSNSMAMPIMSGNRLMSVVVASELNAEHQPGDMVDMGARGRSSFVSNNFRPVTTVAADNAEQPRVTVLSMDGSAGRRDYSFN